MKKIFLIVSILLVAAACNKSTPTNNNQTTQRSGESLDSKSNIATFDSNLGVSFKFRKTDPQYPTTITKVAQQGNKIYVYVVTNYQPDAAPASGQWIEVISKNPALSLDAAIKNDFLKQYPKCQVKIMNPTDAGFAMNRPSGYEVATITPLESCPAEQVYAGGIRYFVTDQNHPDKYAFLSIGQYSIPFDDHTSWDQTLEFK